MTPNPEDEKRLKNYLLGELTQEDTQRLEDRLLRDDSFVEHIRLIEDELVEDYERGSLSPHERERFETYFLSTPRRRRKLMFVRHISKFAGEAVVPEPAPQPLSWISSLFIPRWRVALLSALAVLIVLAGVGIWRAFFNRSEIGEGLRALNAAYRSRRPVEARITGFAYAPWYVTRNGVQPEVDITSRDRAERLLLDAAHDHPGPDAEHALGQLYLAEHKYDQAMSAFERALQADARNAQLNNDLGVALFEKGRTEKPGDADEKSIEALGRSVEQFNRAVELDDSLLEAHFNRALVYQQMALRRQAEEGWKEYLRRDANSPWADEARRNLNLLEESSHAAAMNNNDSLQRFLDAARSGDDDTAWKVIGQSYTSAGNEVTNSLLDAELGLASPGNLVERGASLPALSSLARLELDRDGDRYTSDMVGHYERATPQQRVILREARTHMKAGYEFFTMSRWTEAVGEYERATLAYERAGDDPERVFVEYRLAHCYIFLPDLEKARASFEKLLATSDAREYRWLHAHSLYGLAHVSINSNEFSKGAEYSGRALSEFERASDFNGVLRCLVQLADINRDLNRVGRSLSYLQRGLDLMSDGSAEPSQMWGILVQVAFGLSSKRLNTAALSYQKEALSVALDMGRPLLISRSYGYLGSAYALMKMYDKALDSVTRAFEIGQGMPEGAGGAEIMANASQQFGDILRQSGQCGRAVEAYDRSIRLYDGLHVEYYSYAAHRGKLICFMAASDDGAAGEELRTVLSLFERYRSKITADNQRNSFFDKQQDIYDLAIRYGYERMRDPALAFAYSEESRARSLLELLRKGGEVLDKGDAPDLSLSAETRPLTLAEIQNSLPEKTQVLQYALLEDKLLIWVVTKSGIHIAEAGIRAQELTEKVRAYLAAVSKPSATDGDAELAARAADLYRVLVAPAEPFLDRAKFLCIVPDKVLHYLPFGALVSPATGKYLIEDFNLGLSPSASIFVAESASAGEREGALEERLLSVGEPSFNRAAFTALPPLPSAAREAVAVSDFYRTSRRVLLREEASEQLVKSELQKADVAHFAMHYLVNESSEMLSGFPLAPERDPSARHKSDDGFLQSYEIYKMNLTRTRLVVLSACQTGIEQQYNGEGAVGLARPFLVAGVPAVVASLWPVDTDASAELMISFHRHRRRDALPTTEALRRAQIEMARGPDLRHRHPYYWAPFVAIGGHARF
jgi:CHAT domain-containing protein